MTESDVRVFVEEAANIINLPVERQEQILKRLDEECISKKWQLKSVSNEQWESMGAPIGFVLTLKTCLDKRQLEELKEELNGEVNKAMAVSSGQQNSSTRQSGRLRRGLSKSKLDAESNQQQQDMADKIPMSDKVNTPEQYNGNDWLVASITTTTTNPKRNVGLHLHHGDDGMIRVLKIDGAFEMTDVKPGDRLLELNERDVSSFEGGLSEIQQVIQESLKVQVKVLQSSTNIVKEANNTNGDAEVLEIKAGDTLMVSGSGDNNLDGQLVALKRKSSKQGRWLAQVQDSGKMTIVDDKHLSDKDGNPLSRKSSDIDADSDKEVNPVALALRRRNSKVDIESDDKEANRVARALRRKNSLKEEIEREIYDMITGQPIVRRRERSLGPRRRSNSSGGSLRDVSVDDKSNGSGDRRRVSKSPESRCAIIGHDVSDKELAIKGQQNLGNPGPRPRRRRRSSSSGDLNGDDKRSGSGIRRRRLSSSSGGSLRDLDVDDKDSNLGRRRRSRSSSSGDLNVDDKESNPAPRLRVSKSPESRRAVIGHDVSDKELEIKGQPNGGNSNRPRRRRLSPSSGSSLRDVTGDEKSSGADPRRRVSKSPESRRAVIGHDVSNKELEIAGERITSPVPRRRKVRSLDDDIDTLDDDDQEESSLQRRNSLEPMARPSNPSETLRNLGDLSDSKKDSNHPLSWVSPRQRRSKGGLRRTSKSPEKRRAVMGHDTSDKDLDALQRNKLNREKSREIKLDAVERSRLSRELSRRRLAKSKSLSHIVPLKSADENSLSSSRRRRTSDDESSISSSRRRRLKSTSDEENSLSGSLRRNLKSASDDDENSLSSRRRRGHGSSDGESSVSSRPRPTTRRSSSNRSMGVRKVQRSQVLAPPTQSPGRLVRKTSLSDKDTTMKSRRLARARRRASVGSHQSPHRSFSRCRSESPAAKRALLLQSNLPNPPLFERANSEIHRGRSTAQSEPVQFQPSLHHALQRNYRSNISHSDDASVASFASIQSSRSLEHSSKVKKNSESGRFCYMSRGKIIYEWNQDFDTMVLLVPKPPGIPEEDIFCTIEVSSLQLGQIHDKTTFFHRPLGGKCMPEKSIWVPYGGADVKGIIVHLKKANPGEKWKRPLLAHPNTRAKEKKPPERRESVPHDFGSPSLQMNNVGKSTSRWRRRLGMGQRSSSSNDLEMFGKNGAGGKDLAEIATPQHANGFKTSSAHSAEYLLDLSGDEDERESLFWGSTHSLPALGTLANEDSEGNERTEKKQRRRRIKKGNRQKFMQAAHAISPFSLKRKMRRTSTDTAGTDSSNNNQSQEKNKDRRLGLRTSLSEKIEAIAKGHESTTEALPSSYQQLDGDDDESSFSSTHEEELVLSPPPGQIEPEIARPPTSFTNMLAAAAPLPFDADDNTVSTLGPTEAGLASSTKRKVRRQKATSSEGSSNLPNQAPRSPSRVLSLVDNARGVSPASPWY